MSKSRAQIIRELAAKEGGQVFIRQIMGAFGAVTAAEKQAVWGSVMGLVRAGQMKRIGDWGNGLYEVTERTKAPRRCVVGKGRAALWRAIRINREGFTVDDLVLHSGCGAGYAREYIQSLRRDGFIDRRKGNAGWRVDGRRGLAVYHLVKDQLEAPVNTLGIRKEQKKKERKKA